MNTENFSDRLRLVMDSGGITTSSLHKKSNIAESSISKFRSGARKPCIENLGKLIPHLPRNTDLYWLITGKRK